MYESHRKDASNHLAKNSHRFRDKRRQTFSYSQLPEIIVSALINQLGQNQVFCILLRSCLSLDFYFASLGREKRRKFPKASLFWNAAI